MSFVIRILIGVATVYGAFYAGQPLYCDDGLGEPLIYSESTVPWVAVDVGEYESGRIRCGDELWLRFGDGSELRALALDAGYLAGYYVEQWGSPIVVDIPEHLAPFPGLSAPVQVVNHSAAVREFERRVER